MSAVSESTKTPRFASPQGICGIGVDLCEVARMEKSLARESFVNHTFAPSEQALLANRRGSARAQTAAANFAAKEAFLKAAGTGLGGFSLTDIAVLRDEGGAPYYACTGAAAAWLAGQHLAAHLSLTHEGGMACAFAVVERVPDTDQGDKAHEYDC